MPSRAALPILSVVYMFYLYASPSSIKFVVVFVLHVEAMLCVSLIISTISYFGLSLRLHVQGQQVLISYGKMDNDSLLQYYGFVEADNCFDTYTFLLDTHQDGPDSLETGHHSMPGRPEKGADKLVVNRGGVTVESEAVLRTLCSNRNKHEVRFQYILRGFSR